MLEIVELIVVKKMWSMAIAFKTTRLCLYAWNLHESYGFGHLPANDSMKHFNLLKGLWCLHVAAHIPLPTGNSMAMTKLGRYVQVTLDHII